MISFALSLRCFDMQFYFLHRPVVMTGSCRNAVSSEWGSPCLSECSFGKEFIVGELLYQCHYIFVALS